MAKTMVISAYAGVGKSWLVQNKDEISKRYQFTCLDLDSSAYSKDDEQWVLHYIADIKKQIGIYDFIFVSMRKEVRQELTAQHIPFVTVAPDNVTWTSTRERLLTKQQWFGRFLLRDNSHIKNFPEWLKNMIDGYDCTTSIDNLTAYGAKSFFLLKHDQYLSDIIIDLYEKKEFHQDLYDAANYKFYH